MNVSPDDVLWSTKHFVTKLGMVMHHHEPECDAKRLALCLQGQGHSKVIYYKSMTVSTVSSDLFILLHPNSMVNHRKTGCPCEKNWITAFKVKVAIEAQNVSEWLDINVFSNAEPFVTKLGMAIHHHAPECHAHLQGQGDSEASYNQIWLYHIHWTADPLAAKLNGWYIIVHWSVWYKNWIVVFKDKVRLKFKNVTESLSILYFLYHWSLRHQTRCVDVLVLVLLINSTKNITNKQVPVASPSRGEDVVVYVKDINQPSLPTPFSLYSCVYFCLYDPFNYISSINCANNFFWCEIF